MKIYFATVVCKVVGKENHSDFHFIVYDNGLPLLSNNREEVEHRVNMLSGYHPEDVYTIHCQKVAKKDKK